MTIKMRVLANVTKGAGRYTQPLEKPSQPADPVAPTKPNKETK